MYMYLYWKIIFVYLFTLFDTERREIQTPRRSESVVSTKTNAGPKRGLCLHQFLLISLAQENL